MNEIERIIKETRTERLKLTPKIGWLFQKRDITAIAKAIEQYIHTNLDKAIKKHSRPCVKCSDFAELIRKEMIDEWN